MRVERQLWFWVAALVVLVLAIALLRDILLPFVAAVVVAYFLNPIADRLQGYGLNRTWAAILVVGVVAVLVALALILLVPVLADQVRQLVTALPGETERFKIFVERFGRDWLGPSFPSFQTTLDRALADLSQNWAAMAGAVMASVWSRGLALVNFVSLLLITPVVVFYLLVDWHPDAGAPRRRAAARLRRHHPPPGRRHQRRGCRLHPRAGHDLPGARRLLRHRLELGRHRLWPAGGAHHRPAGLRADRRLGAGADFCGCARHRAVLAGPRAAVESRRRAGRGIAIDTAFLSPRFVGQKVGLHPVWMIFALFVFSYLFGLVGTLVAVPLAAAIGVLVRFAVQQYLDSSVYKGSGAAAEGSAVPVVKDRP